jgi:hypothetical protein
MRLFRGRIIMKKTVRGVRGVVPFVLGEHRL